MSFWKGSSKDSMPHFPNDSPQRITTVAGQRLSVIMENGSSDAQLAKARESVRQSKRISGPPPAYFEGFGNGGAAQVAASGHSASVWSDGEKKIAALKNHRQVAKRGGWKRLAILLGLLLMLAIALGLGLGLGLRDNNSNGNNTQPGGGPTSPSTPTTTTTTTTTPLSPSSTPTDFPRGSYSLVTFLDTVQTNCTANSATWSCYPYTTYYTDATKSGATFNWVISGNPGAYTLSSTNNPFSVSISNAKLSLLDAGKDTERYTFQIAQTKTVSPSQSITTDNSATECDFPNTNLQAYLYTKMAKSYPNTFEGEPSGNPSYPVWPYAVRVEQVVGGGDNVPSCYKLNNGQKGDEVSLEAQDAGSLCSCLYKNWRTSS